MLLSYFGSKENHEVKIFKNTSWKVFLEGNSPIPTIKDVYMPLSIHVLIDKRHFLISPCIIMKFQHQYHINKDMITRNKITFKIYFL